jgi:hypothetical protein
MAVWTLVAPLGELPEKEAVEAIAEFLRREEEGYRRRKLLNGSLRWWRYEDPLWYVLRRTQGKEGVLSDQADGGWVSKWYVYRFGPAATSVLAAVGVRAERSVFVLQYERTQTTSTGRAPELMQELKAGLKDIPEARTELEVLERGLAIAAIFLVIHCTSRVDSDSAAGVSLERLWLRPFTHEARTKPGSLGLGPWAAKAWPT